MNAHTILNGMACVLCLIPISFALFAVWAIKVTR